MGSAQVCRAVDEHPKCANARNAAPVDGQPLVHASIVKHRVALRHLSNLKRSRRLEQRGMLWLPDRVALSRPIGNSAAYRIHSRAPVKFRIVFI